MTGILLLLLLASSSVLAQTDDVTLNIPTLDYRKVGKPVFIPEIFLINQRGEFLLKFNQVTRDGIWLRRLMQNIRYWILLHRTHWEKSLKVNITLRIQTIRWC
ncbi:hypothetical protein EMM73_07595 [Rheinheimera sediminis]|uniref:hypothetical protein n=1 Tax=Rheinheimera sp. YQF-1 TaxID=2499626 RepID=UPI000FD90301|nr:hypothetical protein [Rheinheimera sp. YQF-1]RVT46728.1 hypothetical protein EMM73_07595 [Rheinheimera sp. YQF-1]